MSRNKVPLRIAELEDEGVHSLRSGNMVPLTSAKLKGRRGTRKP
jgi:hypothetical protein